MIALRVETCKNIYSSSAISVVHSEKTQCCGDNAVAEPPASDRHAMPYFFAAARLSATFFQFTTSHTAFT